MGQCTSTPQQNVYPPGLVMEDVGSSGTTHSSTARNLALYLAENPLGSFRETSKRRSVLKDSASAPVGADMSCSSTMNMSSMEWNSQVENSNSNFERSKSARSLGFERSKSGRSLKSSSNNNAMEKSARSHSHKSGTAETPARNNPHVANFDRSFSSSAGGLAPLPEEVSIRDAGAELTQPPTHESIASLPSLMPMPPKRASNGSSSTNRSSSSRRKPKKAPTPDMDVALNSKAVRTSSNKKSTRQHRRRRVAPRSASETAVTPCQQSLTRKQASMRQSLQVGDLDRSNMGRGKDSSWQGLSCTSKDSALYESYENSGNSWQLSRLHDTQSNFVGTSTMDLSQKEKEAMTNLHGFCFSEGEEEEDSETEAETKESCENVPLTTVSVENPGQ